MNNDLISREALKKAFENLASDDYNEPIWYQKTVFETIDNAPTVETNELTPLVNKVVEVLPELTDAIIDVLPEIVSKLIKCSECSYYRDTWNVISRPKDDNKEVLSVLNHLFYNCDNMTQKEYDILYKAIMKGGKE